MADSIDRDALEAEFDRLMWEDFKYARAQGFKAPQGQPHAANAAPLEGR
jgi:hypothetical protein